MKKTILILALSLMSLSQASFAGTGYSCNAGGDLGDIFCWGALSRAKDCALSVCYSDGNEKCEIKTTSWMKTEYSPITYCRAFATAVAVSNHSGSGEQYDPQPY
jgi:hypothetical protein